MSIYVKFKFDNDDVSFNLGTYRTYKSGDGQYNPLRLPYFKKKERSTIVINYSNDTPPIVSSKYHTNSLKYKQIFTDNKINLAYMSFSNMYDLFMMYKKMSRFKKCKIIKNYICRNHNLDKSTHEILYNLRKKQDWSSLIYMTLILTDNLEVINFKYKPRPHEIGQDFSYTYHKLYDNIMNMHQVLSLIHI